MAVIKLIGERFILENQLYNFRFQFVRIARSYRMNRFSSFFIDIARSDKILARYCCAGLVRLPLGQDLQCTYLLTVLRTYNTYFIHSFITCSIYVSQESSCNCEPKKGKKLADFPLTILNSCLVNNT